MKALLVGLGSIGRRHLENLRALGVPELWTWRFRCTTATPADVRTFETLDAALELRPDLVLVCNPTSQHLPVARRALEAGCALFVEKPLSHTLAGVDDLVVLARRSGVPALVGFNMRFEPGLRHVHQLVADGAIGRPLSVRAHVGQYLPDWHPWEDYRQGVSAHNETGGGVVLDLIHELDYVRWIMGEVEEVAAIGGHLSSLEIETEDIAEILLRFTGGSVGSVHVDYLERTLARSCRVIGEEGTVTWDGVAREVSLYRPGRGRESFPQPDSERNQMYLDEMRHLLDCVAGKAEPVVSLEDAAAVLRIALAARESLARRPVRGINLPPRD